METKIRDRNALNASLVQQITAGTGITVNTTTDDGVVHRTVFTVPSTAQAVASAALSFGKELGTMPKINFFTNQVYVDLTYVSDGTCTVQADIGVGTLLASGAYTTLNDATNEDCLDGQTSTAYNGTTPAVYEYAAFGEIDIKDGGTTAKSLYLNFAGNWVTTVGLTYSGTVTVVWSKLA